MELIESLRLQLAEVEMLTSMYPDDSEFTIDDPAAITHITDYAEGKTNLTPPRMQFTLYLKLDTDRLELSCSLPQEYPSIYPEVYARSPGLSREQQHHLNAELAVFQNGQSPGELCIMSLIQWLAENATQYLTASRTRKPITAIETETGEKYESVLSRLWIYSHHIYNKGKRRAILELAHDLNLSGFCLPGKPGIICAEGDSRDCECFWQRVKHMNWKKIILKKTEICENTNGTSDFRKFGPLAEVCFRPRPGPGREYHMDMGDFFRFLEQHHCGHVFKDYFGVDGEPSSCLNNGH